MRRFLLTLSVFCFFQFQFSTKTFAQNQHDRVWVMGQGAGVDFNTIPPTAFYFNNHQPSYESDATVCNENGELLFYTNGSIIIDRSENIMPNGNLSLPIPISSFPTSSASQGTLIVPFVYEPNKYYVFSLASYENGSYYGNLYYSVVDMSLNGGLGDVVAGQKAILLGTGHTEHLSAIGECTSGAIWLLSVSRTVSRFVAYKIDVAGINNTPVYSHTYPTGTSTQGITGVITPNSDGSKIVVTIIGLGVNVYDFDANTGMVSNEMVLDDNSNNFNSFYGACFSPDDSKVYYNARNNSYSNNIHQIDLSLSNQANIRASKTEVVTGTNFTDIKIGYDGRVYFKGFSGTHLGAINYPNLAGIACQPDMYAISLNTGTSVQLGLPNIVPVPENYSNQSETSTTEFTICFNTQQDLIPSYDLNTIYAWNTGITTKQITVEDTGTYWVKYIYECVLYCDTFIVTYFPYNEEPFVISDSICLNKFYQFGNKTIDKPGIYKETLQNQYGCDSLVELHLSLKNKPDVEIVFDNKAECILDTVMLQSKHFHSHYEWYMNNKLIDTSPNTQTHLPYSFNQIKLIGQNDNGCTDTALLNIGADACCELFVPNAFSPNGDGINDAFAPIDYGRTKSYEFFVVNRYGEIVFRTSDINGAWNGTINGQPADVGVYFYFVKGKCLDDSDFTQKGDVTLIR